ncbi:4-hydroxy-3-methylbut-2-enyl diphosphate reductase [Candidatus Woesearchaeota archaeon]|nr:4-hydroxy-3-methylbut-2-enyl diphosphate reductase [Candidatus Woesearchaeota archaeon]
MLFGAPVYVKHEIVHNKYVVEQLHKKGAMTVESVEEIPDHSTAVFSAHGSPPEDFEKAKKKNIRVIDATCPLVSKVHFEVQRFKKQGYHIVYIGHKGHVEGKGVLGEAPETISMIEKKEDVKELSLSSEQKLIFLTQTTLSVDDTKEIIAALKEKYPKIESPPQEDICYATTNRQEAIKAIAKEADLILIVGSKNSSNSNRLVETARACGVESYLIEDKTKINPVWLKDKKNIGISSGASVPDYLVQEVVSFFVEKGAKKEEVQRIKEKMVFTEPLELMKMKRLSPKELAALRSRKDF